MVFAVYMFTKFLAGTFIASKILFNLLIIKLSVYLINLGSHATFLGLINSYVHVIMYFYYFLTSFKPELKQSLWWKKHITQLQMVSSYVCIKLNAEIGPWDIRMIHRGFLKNEYKIMIF